jgi:hypothetical protein
MPSIQYKVIFWIENVTSLDLDEAASETLRVTIADTLSTSAANVEYLGVRTVLSRRKLDSSAHELIVATRITQNLVDHPELNGNATRLFQESSGSIRDATSNGGMTAALQRTARSSIGASLYGARVTKVDFEDLSVTTPETNSNGNAGSDVLPLAKAELAAAVGGAVVGFGVLALLIYLGITRCWTEPNDKKSSSEMPQDASFGEIYAGSAASYEDFSDVTLQDIYMMEDTVDRNEIIVLNVMKDYGISEGEYSQIDAPQQLQDISHETTETRI